MDPKCPVCMRTGVPGKCDVMISRFSWAASGRLAFIGSTPSSSVREKRRAFLWPEGVLTSISDARH